MSVRVYCVGECRFRSASGKLYKTDQDTGYGDQGVIVARRRAGLDAGNDQPLPDPAAFCEGTEK